MEEGKETFNEKYLLTAFKQALGLENAEKIITEALMKTKLFSKKNNLTREEVLQVCDYIKENQKGIIKIVASCLIVRINLSQIIEID